MQSSSTLRAFLRAVGQLALLLLPLTLWHVLWPGHLPFTRRPALMWGLSAACVLLAPLGLLRPRRLAWPLRRSAILGALVVLEALRIGLLVLQSTAFDFPAAQELRREMLGYPLAQLIYGLLLCLWQGFLLLRRRTVPRA